MMGGWTGIWQWVVILAIVLLLFGGRGKISQLMGDFGKGLKSFRKGVKDDEPAETVAAPEPKALERDAAKVTEPLQEQDRAAKS